MSETVFAGGNVEDIGAAVAVGVSAGRARIKISGGATRVGRAGEAVEAVPIVGDL